MANDVYRALTRVVSGQASQEILIRDLENIYSQTRNISHEYNPVVTGEQFEVYLIDLFKDFSNEDCRVIYKGPFRDRDWKIKHRKTDCSLPNMPGAFSQYEKTQ